MKRVEVPGRFLGRRRNIRVEKADAPHPALGRHVRSARQRRDNRENNRREEGFVQHANPDSLAEKPGMSFIRNPPGTTSFAASVPPFTGFGNGKSPSRQAKSDRDLPLKRSTAEARPICLHEGVSLP